MSECATTTAVETATFVHVPTPGDHYSPATGSAVMTIIHGTARCHAQFGGQTQVIVSRGTRHDYPIGRCIEVASTPLPSRWQKGIDVGLGRIGFDRPFAGKTYAPAAGAVTRDFDGVVFIHNEPAAVSAIKRAAPKARVCLWIHNRLFDTYRRPEVRRVVEAADRLICVSQYIADDVCNRLGFRSPKVRVVHNGVDTNAFAPAEGPTSSEGKPVVVLFVGRVQPIKGPHLLIQAAVRVMDRQPTLKVRIVGSSGFSATDPLTAYEQELRELARPLGDRAEFVPFVDRARIIDEYRAASILCVPSTWDEPCSLTVPEGLASGMPVIASRRGGIPEVGGDAVLYFNPPDVDALAGCLDQLADENQRREWGRKARERSAELSWERQYDRLREALE